jgi:hypothetical protein
MKKVGLIYFIIFISFYACKKENIELNSSDFVQIGNYEEMIKNSYDTLLIGGYNSAKFIDLDINNDSINDFRLKSEIWGSPSLGQHPQASIICLHENCLIKGLMINDTTFYSYFVNTYYGENGSPVYIQYYHTYSNQRINNDDSIFSVQTNGFKINFLNESDIIYNSEEYNSDKFVLTEGWSATVNGPYPNLTNDTVYYYYETHYYNSNVIPDDRLSYIGIKLNYSDKEKIGWIKLGVIDDYKIILLETAVQK